jgi:ribokinase
MITVFGSINIDLVTRVPSLPRPGETVLAASYRTLCGGKGANQAVAAARALGGLSSVRMIGAVGDDGFGALARDNLIREGVDASRLQVCDEGTGCAFIQVDDAGENVITVASGANGMLTAAAMDGAVPTDGDILVVQMETPLRASLLAAERAMKNGARVIANLAPVPAGLNAAAVKTLLAVIDILVVNEHEAAQAAVLLEPEARGPLAAAKALAAHSGRTVIATLGSDGAVAVLPNRKTIRVSAPPIAPVDTTGAGDTFVGVLAAGLAEGLALCPAIERACKAASLACMALGAQSSMPHRAVILT